MGPNDGDVEKRDNNNVEGIEEAPPSRENEQTEDSTAGSTDISTTVARQKNKKKKKEKKKKKKKKGVDGAVLSSSSSQQLPDVCLYTQLDTFRVTKDAIAGRCVVASRDLAEGELVLDEPPFAKVVRIDCALRHCAACCHPVQEAARIETDTCTVYCSPKCKADEDALRSAESSVTGQLADISVATDVDLDLLRMMVRLVVTRARALDLQLEEGVGEEALQDGEAERKGEQAEGWGATGEGSFLLQQWRNAESLIHHRGDMPLGWINAVRAAATDVMPLLPKWAQCDVEEMVELACRVNVNAHGLRDDSGSNCIIGVGMFPLTAMINHSCRPNCTFVFHGGKMGVRTLHPVKAGTELTVYYIDLLQSKSFRRRDLFSTKHFFCTCSRCKSPDPVDAYLDGVCCVHCGQNGCLTPTPPPSPEDALAAQLALLGEDSKASGKGKRKGNVIQPAAGEGASTRIGAVENVRPQRNVRRGDETGVGGGGSGSDRNEMSDVLYCSCCGREYTAKELEDAVARANASRDAAMAALQAKDFSGARKKLEKWLEDYDAGSATPSAASKKKSAKKGGLKLHPMNTAVVQTVVPLASCCNFEGDHSTAARHLRRAVSAMEAVYPPNFPELGDFHAALAEALTSYLEKRGQSLPSKLRDQAARERKQALSRAAAIRSVCLGEEHPTTKEALRALARV